MPAIMNNIIKNLFSRQPTPKTILNKLYRKIDGAYISRCERDRLNTNDTSFIYGEVMDDTFAELLAKVHQPSDKVFYDLGSGVGKAVFCAAMLYDWEKCVGIESLPGLADVSEALLQNFLKMKEVQKLFANKHFPIQFIKADFLEIDFSDADVIFINATTLNAVLWGKLEEKLQQIRSGTRLLVTTRKLDPNFFAITHQAMYPMSWGDCSVTIYQKN